MAGELVSYHANPILVGTDFSPYSLPAIQRAMMMAVDGAVVELAHAWRPAADGARLVDQAPAMVAAERGRAAVDSYPQSRVRLSFHGFEGEPGHGLVERASQDGSDLIAVGTHGYRGIRHLVLGSVAEHVVRHAPCAVLVAR